MASTNLQVKVPKLFLRVAAVESPVARTTYLPFQQLLHAVLGVVRPCPFPSHDASPARRPGAALHSTLTNRIHIFLHHGKPGGLPLRNLDPIIPSLLVPSRLTEFAPRHHRPSRHAPPSHGHYITLHVTMREKT